MWTQFWDMHSGGGLKENPYNHIYIEAPQDEAVKIFYNRFGHNPYRVTCTCCGEDYSVEEFDTLEQATGYERGCHYGYVDKDGNEVTKKEALTRNNNFRKGYSMQYVEKPDERKYATNKYCKLEEYIYRDDVLVIRKEDINEEERHGDVPAQGYVWI